MIESIIMGTIGVGLLLLAFFLNLFKIIMEDSKSYIIMNIFGAGLAAWCAVLLGTIPFVVLESAWAIFAVIKLIKVFKK